ncbi:MAG: hypothetical protein IJK89_01630 [Clostridia bacterium]|nr:hypothetical protein [Clostridia bacterium]
MSNNEVIPAASAGTERYAAKYLFLREKLLKNYQKGKRIYRTVKIAVAALFIAFTLTAALIGRRTGQPMGPLVCWILLLFLIVFLFVAADYAKYLLEDKVIPYLEDDEALEYGEYDIFKEDDETVEREDDEDE